MGSLPKATPPSGTPPLLPIPLLTLSPPLLLPSTVCRAGVSEVTLPPWKRLCIALGPRYEVGESSSAPTARPTRGFRVDYDFVDTLDDEIRRAPATDDTELGRRMIEFAIIVRQDTNEIYGRLDEAHDARAVLSEARLSCEAWGRSMDASDTARSEKMAPKRTTRSTPAITATPTTSMTDEQLKRLIDQGVADALAERDAERS
ncbi:hypothetical protein Tco_0765045 [Tanacetum coccineum]